MTEKVERNLVAPSLKPILKLSGNFKKENWDIKSPRSDEIRDPVPLTIRPITPFDDCTYECDLGISRNKLPPVIIRSPRDELPNPPTPRTPRTVPRTPPSSPKFGEDSDALIQKKKSEFFVNELLMNINFENIVEMRKSFDDAGGGVSLPEFVKIMKSTINGGKSQSSVIAQLCNLFAEIDIDGDKEMTWEEFTNFIVRSGLQSSESTRTVVKEYQQITPKVEIPLSSPYSMKYMHKLEKLVVCDRNKDKTLRLYKPGNSVSQECTLFKELKAHDGAVLSYDFIETKNYFVTAGAEKRLALWDTESNFRYVYIWNVDKIIELSPQTPVDQIMPIKFQPLNFKKHHFDMATSLAYITNTPLICSGGLDSTIITWDVNTGTKQRELEGHVKGIFSLAYSHEHRFLVSGGNFDRNFNEISGSDREALVWNPVVKRHHSSLCGVEVVEGSPQIITADLGGVVKIWDSRTFECIQTFEGSTSLAAFTHTGTNNQLLCSTPTSVNYFQYDKPGTPWLTMEFPIVACFYNKTNSTFLTAGGDTLKIWDAKTGRILRIFKGLANTASNESISAVCLDSSMKKVIIGDTEGNITVLNYSNGAILRSLDPHRSVVSQLIYANDETKSIISGSWDSTVSIHDELDSNKKGRSTLRSFTGHKKDVSCMAHSDSMSLVSSGTANGVVWVWDYEKCGLEAKFEHGADEITSLLFLQPYPILVSADNKGVLMFWTVKPAPNKYQQLATYVNLGPLSKPAAITCMAFTGEDKLLYCGDESGQILVYDLTKFFQKAEILSLKTVKSSAKRKVARYGEGMGSALSFKAPKVSSTDIVLVNSWKAHYSSVTCLQIIETPKSIVSASTDKRVRTWELNGTYCGTLRQAPKGGRWRFPFDESEKQKIEEKAADEILSVIHSDRDLRSRKRRNQSGTPEFKNGVTVEDLDEETERVFVLERGKSKESVPSKLPKTKFAPNNFYENTRMRLLSGDPDIDKFRDNQNGSFPQLAKGLPIPLQGNQVATLITSNSITKPKAPHGLDKALSYSENIKLESLPENGASAATKLTNAIANINSKPVYVWDATEKQKLEETRKIEKSSSRPKSAPKNQV